LVGKGHVVAGRIAYEMTEIVDDGISARRRRRIDRVGRTRNQTEICYADVAAIITERSGTVAPGRNVGAGFNDDRDISSAVIDTSDAVSPLRREDRRIVVDRNIAVNVIVGHTGVVWIVTRQDA